MEILGSLGIVFLAGFAAQKLCLKLHLPPLIGYLLLGMAFGPFGLGLVSQTFLDLSSSLRQFALIVILIRAGIGLDLEKLKENGFSAVMLCFFPALCEIIGYALLSSLLGFSLWEGALLGGVMAAVSPAVIVPRMLRLDQEGYSRKTPVPQLIMAGASLDDIFAITVFSFVLAVVKDGTFSWNSLFAFPVQAFLGAAAGTCFGWMLNRNADRLKNSMAGLMLGFSFVFVWIEKISPVPFSGLLAVFVMAAMLHRNKEAVLWKSQYSSLWNWGEMILFFLVGSAANPGYLTEHLPLIVPVMLLALCFRTAGVWISIAGSSLSGKEKVFSVIAYLPKATVQAGIGMIPLSSGLPCGSLILAFSVAAILITAPAGALLIDNTYKKLLN
ncbi:MAG: cation:proton antiporter [Erysipelotrichaceae bacterium]|nr:cation:proton antiporter [Erysipelotrichaceae bacterium]